MNNKAIFITGTGTDIGKTIVSSLILRYLRLKDINAAPMKPIQTGCEKKDDKLLSPDLEFSLSYSGLKPTDKTKEQMSPYQFIPACSPHLAADMADTQIDIDNIKKAFDKLNKKYDFVIVEGAGGLLVPISENVITTDLINKLDIEIIIVTATGLGTINQTLMTIEIAKKHSIPIKGIIFNNNSPITNNDDFIRMDNPEIISKISGIEILGNIRYMKELPESDDDFINLMNEDCPGLLDNLQ